MRTRKHVAALALVEPTFFRGIMDDIQAATTNRQQAFLEALDDQINCHLEGIMPPGLANIARRFGLVEWEVEGLATEFANGRPARLPVPEPRTADVARTHRYLVDLDRRLREWREAEAARKAVIAGTAVDPEAEREAARQREAMADAEANGDLDLLAEVA